MGDEVNEMMPFEVSTGDLVAFHQSQQQQTIVCGFKGNIGLLAMNDVINFSRVMACFIAHIDRNLRTLLTNKGRQEMRGQMLKYEAVTSREIREIAIVP